MSVTL